MNPTSCHLGWVVQFCSNVYMTIVCSDHNDITGGHIFLLYDGKTPSEILLSSSSSRLIERAIITMAAENQSSSVSSLQKTHPILFQR